MTCDHITLTSYGLKLIFPSDWYIKDTRRCTVGRGYDEDEEVWLEVETFYTCYGVPDDGTIVI